MLLRSASTPILNSWTPNSSSISPSSSDQIKSITLTSTSSYCISNSTTRNMFRTSSFGSDSSVLGLREKVVEEDGFGSSDGGGGCDGGGGGGLFWDNNCNDSNNNDKIDNKVSNDVSGVEDYYVKMIEANPGNSLLLGNYAKFLKEVQGDYMKAEEYCGRAILANPGDPSMLALYADLIWQTQRDSSRAETYFDQAVKAAPDDCYVLGSYAHFLWDAEDEDEECDMIASSNGATPVFFNDVSPSPPPLAAAF